MPLIPLRPSGQQIEVDGKSSSERREQGAQNDRVTLSPSVPGSITPGNGLRPSQAVTPAEKKALLDADRPRQRVSLYG
jgi:hypothetical protein